MLLESMAKRGRLEDVLELPVKLEVLVRRRGRDRHACYVPHGDRAACGGVALFCFSSGDECRPGGHRPSLVLQRLVLS